MRIKLSNSVPSVDLARQTPGHSAHWGGHEFLINTPTVEVDAWVIMDGLHAPDRVKCPGNRTILFAAEPPAYKRYDPHWTRRFSQVVSAKTASPPLLWLLGQDYDLLEKDFTIEKKQGLLSAICSRKTTLPGHRRRLDFLEKLRGHIEFDFFGRGFREIADKQDGLAPYRYSIAMENSVHLNYWTEKIADCFLTETVPVYFGCPNIEKFFPPESYILINPAKPQETAEKLKRILSPEDYLRRLPALREAKKLALNRYNLFPTIIDLIEHLPPPSSPEEIEFSPEPPPPYWRKKLTKIWRKLPFSA